MYGCDDHKPGSTLKEVSGAPSFFILTPQRQGLPGGQYTAHVYNNAGWVYSDQILHAMSTSDQVS